MQPTALRTAHLHIVALKLTFLHPASGGGSGLSRPQHGLRAAGLNVVRLLRGPDFGIGGTQRIKRFLADAELRRRGRGVLLALLALRLRRRRQLFGNLREEGRPLIDVAIAFREGAGFDHGKDKGQIAQETNLIVEAAAFVGAGAAGAFADDRFPVHAGQGRGGKIELARPEQSRGRQDDQILRAAGKLAQRAHVKIGRDHAEKIHAVIQRRGQHDFRPEGALLHMAAQGTAVLLLVLVQQGNEVEFLEARAGFLPQKRAVILDPGKTAQPGIVGKEFFHPLAGRRPVGIHHGALEAGKLHVNAHHAGGQRPCARREITLFAVVHRGGHADIGVPHILGGFPDVLGRLVGTAGGQGQTACQHRATKKACLLHADLSLTQFCALASTRSARASSTLISFSLPGAASAGCSATGSSTVCPVRRAFSVAMR